jgi:DNA mismatch repair protein MutS2
MSILDELIRRGTRVVVTTHLTQLKAYGLGRELVNNVSVEFHPETLKPTFRLLYDVPGESHAILTAERIGLPASLIHAARGYVDKAAGGSSELIRSLHEKTREVEERGRELEEKQKELQTRLDRIRSDREEIVEEFRKKASSIIRRAETEIADLQRSLKSKKIKDRPKPGGELKRIRNEIERDLGIPLEKRPRVPQPGARVRITSLGKEGIVQSIRDKEEVEVTVGKLKVRADCNDLTILDDGLAKKSSSKKERIRVDIPIATPRREVNVVGLRVDDALPVVERAVDEALLGGLSSLNIIHGKGTGRLKQAIWEHLSGHSLVRGFHVADICSGGEGVTVVELEAD